MANRKTELRETSPLVGIAYFFAVDLSYDISEEEFVEQCPKEGEEELYYDLLSIAGVKFTNTWPLDNDTVTNGYILAYKILQLFQFEYKPRMEWVGGQNIDGDDLTDIKIDDYCFSLKEDSKIFSNGGLATLYSRMTGEESDKINIFMDYARKEYDEWFYYTFYEFALWLDRPENKDGYTYKDVTSYHDQETDEIIIKSKNKESWLIPEDTEIETYLEETTGAQREHSLSKWIFEELPYEPAYDEYLKLKKKCSETAGQNFAWKLFSNPNSDNVARACGFRDYPYFYAKVHKGKATIYYVPPLDEKTANLVLYAYEDEGEKKNFKVDVPESQLNIRFGIYNSSYLPDGEDSKPKTIEFHIECRFAHGQFQGCPESKLYCDTPVEEFCYLYNDPIEGIGHRHP